MSKTMPRKGDCRVSALLGRLTLAAALLFVVSVARADPPETPTIFPDAGAYTTPIPINISTTDPTLAIRFTTNGTAPSRTAGILYTGSFMLSTNTTVKAVAYDPTDPTAPASAVATIAYTFTGMTKAPTPVITPNGGTSATPIDVTISAGDGTTNYTIMYTVDGSAPSRTNGTIYNGDIFVYTNLALKAVAFDDTTQESAVATANFTKMTVPKAANVTITPAAGTYTTAITVSMTTTEAGATILYTIDGTTPSRLPPNGNIFGADFVIYQNTTVKAIAYTDDKADSAVTTAAYVFNLPAIGALTFTPAPGTYTETQLVTISSTTTTVPLSIRYTTDGTTPTITKGLLYDGTIIVTFTQTLKAIAYTDASVVATSQMSPSAVATGAYTINLPPAPPVITSGPFANPVNGLKNKPVTFTVAATGTAPLSYAWDFGDGTPPPATTTSAVIVHTYTATGTYTVTVVVTDGNGSTATGKIVNFQVYLDPSQMPKTALTLLKATGAVKVAARKDTFTVKGTIDSGPRLVDVAGKSFIFKFGGAQLGFTPSLKGKDSPPANRLATLSLVYKAPKGLKKDAAGGTLTFTIQGKNGNWAAAWGIDPATTQSGTPLTFIVDLPLNGVDYQATAAGAYSAKSGGGSFTLIQQ